MSLVLFLLFVTFCVTGNWVIAVHILPILAILAVIEIFKRWVDKGFKEFIESVKGVDSL